MLAIARVCAAITAFALGVGCAAIDRTSDESWWGGYRPGETYALRSAVFLLREAGDLVVMPPRYESSQRHPPTVRQYQLNPKQWPRVIDVLPEGTQVMISSFVQAAPPTDLLHVYGNIHDGRHRGERVNLTSLSQHQSGTVLLAPNDAYLQRVPRS